MKLEGPEIKIVPKLANISLRLFHFFSKTQVKKCLVDKGTEMATLKIKGMKCQHCLSSVTKALEAIAGVSNVSVDLDKAEATYDAEATVDQETLRQAIRKIGFDPQ